MTCIFFLTLKIPTTEPELPNLREWILILYDLATIARIKEGSIGDWFGNFQKKG